MKYISTMHFKEFVTASLLLCSGLCNSRYTDISFLKDFFETKNMMLTASLCWDKSKLSSFFWKNLNKMISVSMNLKNDYDRFFLHLNTNNFYVLDLRNCAQSETLMDVANRKDLFRYPLKFLLLTNASSYLDLLDKINSFYIPPASNVLIAVDDITEIKIYQPYKIIPSSNMIIEKYGYWNKSGLQHFKLKPIISRRSNYQQNIMNVTVCLFHNESVKHLNDFRYLRVDSFAKQGYPVIHALMEYINASINIRIVDNYGYYNNETKQWNGLIRDLQDKKSEISGSPLYFNMERYTAIDYIRPQGILDIKFLVRQPSLSYITNIYLLTFTINVWYAIMAVMLLFIPFLYFMLNWECKYKEMVSKQNKYTMSDVSLITLEALCQQGTTTEPRSYSGRTITLIFFSTFMFLYVSYSAYIVVLMQSTIRINNLMELLESRIEVGGVETNYMKHYFESQKGGVYEALYRKKIYPNQYFPLEAGMKKVQLGNFAFHAPISEAYNYILEKFTNYDICGLQTLPGYIHYTSYVGVRKNSPYKKLFSVGLAQIVQSGLQDRISRRTFLRPKCFQNAGNFQSVRFYDCHFVFLIYVTGCVLSLLILAIEIQLAKYMKKIAQNFNVVKVQAIQSK